VTVNDLNATDITVQQPANLTVSDLTAPSSGVQGETITVTANITNTGTLLGNGTVQFAIDVDDNGIWGDDGDVVLTEEVSVPGEETTQVEFEVDTTDLPAGTYDHQVTVDESSMSDEITIEEPAFFAVSDLQPTDYVAEHDEVFTVNATVENTGDLSAEKTVELRLDGETVANKTVELDAGNSTTVEFDVDASGIDAGEYTHSVWTEDEEAEGTLTVERKAPVVVGDDPAKDLDGDGLYEDVNGDNTFDLVDVQALYQNWDSDVVQNNVDLFDFNGDGNVNLNDVQALYSMQQEA
jgi:PKD repeat protein